MTRRMAQKGAVALHSAFLHPLSLITADSTSAAFPLPLVGESPKKRAERSNSKEAVVKGASNLPVQKESDPNGGPSAIPRA